MIGQTTLDGPEGVRAFFRDLFAAMPDFAFAVESVTAEEDQRRRPLERDRARSRAPGRSRASRRPGSTSP